MFERCVSALNKSILDLVGNTPLLNIQNTNIYVKLECFNPTGSIKDRAAKQMLLKAIEDGSLENDAVIIEPTSGNTGIGLAAIGAYLGHKVILTMPETMSEERRKFLKAYGAELVLTEGKEGMQGAVLKAIELAQEYSNAFLPKQFDNPNNPMAHYLTTGPEIWEQMEGQIDILVAGIGTGGTIMGTGKYLKEKNPNLKIIGVEPALSPMLSKGYAGKHHIEGIGAGFIPSILDLAFLDEIMAVSDEEAIKATRSFVKREGIFVGISSGAALFAAYRLSKRFPDKKIVAILPDSGDRYFSTDLLK
ncbi:MAG: cysteine synthase A [Anaeroplasmataceae bacterium]|nr:cysteine synthase A [Anaeroplasmataceae bacterium]